MSAERGDVLFATDPFKDAETAGRPFLVINRSTTPFHGEQYIALALTTRTWHDERIPLSDEDWVNGGAPDSSSVMPWSVTSVKEEWVDYQQGTLRESTVDRAVSELLGYIK